MGAAGLGGGGCGEGRHLSWSSRCLMSDIVGTAGGRFHLVAGAGFRRNGLLQVGCDGVTDGALVLVGQMGLLHTDSPVAAGQRMGVVGSGILVATCWISVLSSRSCFSRVATCSWCAVAHSSTFPWKLTRCWFRAMLASARKDTASFTQAS